MGRIANQLRVLALGLGAPGLFLIAFLDSSFLSLPEIADLLLVWMVTQHKTRLLLYVASITVGSLCGCLVLYSIGLKGGQPLVRKRFPTGVVERTVAALKRHGFITVLVACLLPPPAPFKLSMLLAGVAGISAPRFIVAVGVGRLIRYLALGLLAVEYGDLALTYLKEHGAAVSIALVASFVLAFIAYLRWTRKSRMIAGNR